MIDPQLVLLSSAMAPGGIRSVYQPIVRLDSSEVVGYEALARGPAGSGLERPDQLFAAARHHGLVEQLDTFCRDAALEGALGRIDDDLTLFVNVEPEGLRSDTELFARLGDLAGETLRVVVEVTERAITARPAELIATIERARGAGFSIALDDVGADPASLALLPLLAPDVIKLDLSLIQGGPTIEAARIHAAVSAENERSGAIVLAEGIETPAHLRTARSLGATLGQGYLFGRPGAIGPCSTSSTLTLPLPSARPVPPGATPFEIIAHRRATRVATKDTLIAISELLEEQAADLASPGVCLSAFQEARNLTPATRLRYGRVAAASSLVAVFAADLTGHHIPGVRTGALGARDRLRGEWSVIVLGAHSAAALVARDLGDTGDELDRRYDYAMTHDRALAVAAARTLLDRIDPLPG